MTCNICQFETLPYFVGIVLKKYDVSYFRCPSCNFIQTEKPFWLEESYESAISTLDVGLIQRNLHLAPLTETVLKTWFNPNERFIDYGGGYGMFVRMMRDRGFSFYRQDTYCENLFAKYFDITDLPNSNSFELITAFEVFEHLPDPITELGKMTRYSNNILFSTQIQPFTDVKPSNWWYFMMDAGQHVSLYSRRSLQILADKLGLYYNYTEHDLHLFSRRKINNKLFSLLVNPKSSYWYNKLFNNRLTSLLPIDFEYVQHLK